MSKEVERFRLEVDEAARNAEYESDKVTKGIVRSLLTIKIRQ